MLSYQQVVGGTVAVMWPWKEQPNGQGGGSGVRQELETRNLKDPSMLNCSNEHALSLQFKMIEQKILYLGLRFKNVSDKYIWEE